MLSRAHRRVADDVWRRPRANGLTLLSALTRCHGVTRSGRRPGVLCRRFADYLGRTGRDGSA
ncbi:hypothetical protein XAPC_3362 [Xanthomonas citri pv. punicae str. LMG 859]|nr:hypothetical protein XAPC_3362 [Xanthomonas citri pv. punicae str. LMG 859]